MCGDCDAAESWYAAEGVLEQVKEGLEDLLRERQVGALSFDPDTPIMGTMLGSQPATAAKRVRELIALIDD